MLVRFGYQTHLEIRPQPNYRLDEFLLTNPRIQMLLPEQNSFFFFVLREANRKCEPKFNLWPGISSGIWSGISVGPVRRKSKVRMTTNPHIRSGITLLSTDAHTDTDTNQIHYNTRISITR